MPGRLTNTEFVTRLMEYSAFGALSQLFVLHALESACRAVLSKTPDELESVWNNGMISPRAWHGVAREISLKLDARLGREALDSVPGAPDEGDDDGPGNAQDEAPEDEEAPAPEPGEGEEDEEDRDLTDQFYRALEETP